MTGTSTGTTPFVPSASNSAPANSCRCSQFPPHLSGVPPDPVPPLRLRMQRYGVHSPKLGGAGGALLILPWDGKIAALRASAEAALLACGCGARLGARGRPAPPPTAHPLGRVTDRAGARSLRSADKCGGLKHRSLPDYSRPSRVGLLRSSVLAKICEYSCVRFCCPHAELRGSRDILSARLQGPTRNSGAATSTAPATPHQARPAGHSTVRVSFPPITRRALHVGARKPDEVALVAAPAYGATASHCEYHLGQYRTVARRA